MMPAKKAKKAPENGPDNVRMAAAEMQTKLGRLHTAIFLIVMRRNSKYMFLDVYYAFKNAPVQL